MEELRFALLIVGGCAIIAILAHGLWSLRKNNKPSDKPRVEPVQQRTDPEGFDEFGIGEVRVVNKNAEPEPLQIDERTVDDQEYSAVEVDEDVKSNGELDGIYANDNSIADVNLDPNIEAVSEPQAISEPEPEPEQEQPKLYGSVVSNPKPTVKAVKSTYARETKKDSPDLSDTNEQIPEPPPFLLNTDTHTIEADPIEVKEKEDNQSVAPNDEVASFSLDQPSEHPEDESMVSQTKRMVGRKRSRSIQRKRVEPSLGEDQMRIDFETSHQPIQDAREEQVSSAKNEPDAVKPPEQEVLVLNVRAPSEQEIQGAALLPMLLTLGFKFGDQDIFHRHVNSNGKGPVLFSLANMFKPGVFDIDNLENFTTQGVSLFMILPIEGDPHQVFNMMHNAARKLAEEFSCQILDGRRSVLTKQGLQQYIEKIREFERQRIISRS